ncbi:MAG: S8 family serine peptidase [Thermoanaerobaculaceae bacterium]
MKKVTLWLVSFLFASWVAAETTQVFVQLAGPPAFANIWERREGLTAQALAVAGRQLMANRQEQEVFLQKLRQEGLVFTELYRAQRLLNGVALDLDPEDLPRLRAFSTVRGVYPIVPKKPTLATVNQLVGALQAWGSFGFTGRGVRVGIIDTGIDYQHRTFGNSGSFPNPKVVGGYDFAGDNYDASSDTPSKRNPQPDPDPLDCSGHGTHVASIVGGYGVDSAGNAFPGPWGQITSLEDLLVPPGVAPEVELYALKVFGCSGSTALVTAALEWAADPNGDGNPGDHLDIVNLSLGSAYGSDDDVDALAANRATQVGILVVAAAGNDGDTTFITSSPATATRAVSVASSVDSGAKVGAFEVVSPQDLAGRYAASEADFGPNLAGGDVEALLAAPATGEELGCNPFSPASQQALSGKIALINRGTCTFKRKVLNAQNAGAVGVLIVRQDNDDPFTMGNDSSITDPITIPAQMTVLSVGTLLRERLAGGVRVRLTARYRGQFLYVNPEREDTVSTFSSRGPRQDFVLKPDLAAPGETVFAAAKGTTQRGVSLSGTSMATPVVAGGAAILKQARPQLSTQELKALLMNSAQPFLSRTKRGQEPFHRVSRVGAGRLDLARALATTLLMWSEESPEAVSVNFKVIHPGRWQKGVRLKNIANNTLHLELSASQAQPLPGLRLSVVPSRITLAPGQEQLVNVVLETWLDLGISRDATQEATQEGQPRFYLTELSAHLEAREGEEVVSRLPLYAVLQPGGQLMVQPAIARRDTNLTLRVAGAPQPSLSPLLVPLVLTYQATPSNAPRSGRILQAGVMLTGGPEPAFVVGVATEAPWVSPEEMRIQVFLDTNRDDTADFRLENTLGAEKTDTFAMRLCPVPSGTCSQLGPLGGLSPQGPHLPAFATRLMVLSVPLSNLGVSSGTIGYWIQAKDEFGVATTTPKLTFDLSSPPVQFQEVTNFGSLLVAPGSELHAQLAGSASANLLLLFPYNREPFTTQVVPVIGQQGKRQKKPNVR